jgi:predicted nuclease of predicted toxin-antitoxin system
LKLTILLDQNIPVEIVRFLLLRRPEWSVLHVAELGLSRASDETIFLLAQNRKAIVITFDEDFADARMYPLGSHSGVVRLRVWPTTVEDAEAALDRLLTSTVDSDLSGNLIIIDNQRIRIRRFS